MKKVKRIIPVLLLVALLGLSARCLGYMVNDDTRSYTRVMFHQLHHPEKNIDVLFLGASHVYRSLMPEVADEELGAYTFNAGTSMQHLDGSMAIIREAAAKNQLSRVFLDMSYGIANDRPYKERKGLASTYIISDYMRPSLYKLKYLLESGNERQYMNSFVIVRRDVDKLFDIQYVSKLLKKKSDPAYKSRVWKRSEDSQSYYYDRGYVLDKEVVLDRNYWKGSIFGSVNMDKVSEDWLASLHEIEAYCDRHDIELTLFVVPVPEFTAVSVSDYSEYEAYIKSLADEAGLEFYDFNLCKREYFDAADRELFKDEGHLNVNGARIFSKLFADFFTGEIDEEALFFEDYEEKMLSDEIRVYGIYDLDKDSKDEDRRCGIVANRSSGLEYRVTACGQVIRDFDEDRFFDCTLEQIKDMSIDWREAGNGEIHTLEIKYSDKQTEV